MNWKFWKRKEKRQDKQNEMRIKLLEAMEHGHQMFYLILLKYFDTEILSVDFMREIVNQLREDDRYDLERMTLQFVEAERTPTPQACKNHITYIKDRLVKYYKFQLEQANALEYLKKCEIKNEQNS